MGIVPTGELEGRQDAELVGGIDEPIVPTGELEGRQDGRISPLPRRSYCTNWGIGRPVRPCARAHLAIVDCTNWGIGRPARLVDGARGPRLDCTNWGIGRPARRTARDKRIEDVLYQLGNWKAGKTPRERE